MKEIYDLWLQPEGKIFDKYQKIITETASKYGTVGFLPHITLLGVIEVGKNQAIALTNRLAKNLGPIKTRFESVGFTDLWHKCLFIEIEKTPSLTTARYEAEQVFNRSSEKYLPHFSIVYGSLPLRTKEIISRSLQPLEKEPFSLKYLILQHHKGKEVWREVKIFDLK